MSTIANLLRDRAEDDAVALRADERSWTYREFVAECAKRAAWFADRHGDGPPHVGVLLENVPEFSFWLGAAALAGATVVGLNPARGPLDLARDITFTECAVVITDSTGASLLGTADLGDCLVLDTAADRYHASLDRFTGASLPPSSPDPATQFLLVFTSGTSGDPKAVVFSQGRLHGMSSVLKMMVGLTAADVTYCVMPLFHSNALVTSWTPTIAAGATLALRPKFSASNFLGDVRRYGATYFNYVGKPLAYVLATPERADDADNPLVRAFGNEAAEADIANFSRRFGCQINDGYGSSEGGVSIVRTPDTPPGALGRAAETVIVLNVETGQECDRAVFDTARRLMNADAAIGELANRVNNSFEGYWRNNEADSERVTDGVFRSGDLGYRDEAGFFYFAGRTSEWLRVDGENLAVAPIERVVSRFPGVTLAAVYAVPDEVVGDAVMVALAMNPEVAFNADSFADFLAKQADLHGKARPRYVRVVADMPMTETNKVLKRQLQRERWESADPTWRLDDDGYRPLRVEDHAAIRETFAERGLGHLLDR